MMIRAADLVAEARRIPGFARTATVTPDWSPVARRIREEATDPWNDPVAVDRFEKKGRHFVRGGGRLTVRRRGGDATLGTGALGSTAVSANRGIE
jgi:hypothetical protein